MEEAARWLSQAMRDYKAAESNYKIKVYYIASFLCQQSVEKALKALLLKKENRIIKTHDLTFLAKRLGLSGDLAIICAKLNSIYVETRYPDPLGKTIRYTGDETKEDLTMAKEVLEWIKKTL